MNATLVVALIVAVVLAGAAGAWCTVWRNEARRWRRIAHRRAQATSVRDQSALDWFTTHTGSTRTTAADLEPGQRVFVWAHETRSPLAGIQDTGDLWRHGNVAATHDNGQTFLSQQITFDNGNVVYAQPYAVAYIVGTHTPAWITRLELEANHG